MLKRFGSHFRHNVVAYLALFVALGGTAVAAKPLIDSADVQNESLTGADILNDSLQGADILESSLGQVPSAADADTLDTMNSTDFLGATAKAADSDKLDNLDSTAFLSSTAAAGGALTGNYPTPGIASGVIGTAQFSNTIPATRVSGSSQSTPGDSSNTVITFNGEEYDTAALHSTTTNTSRLTAPVTGVYNVTANVRWSPETVVGGDSDGISDGFRSIQVRQNGSLTVSQDQAAPTAVDITAQTLSTEVKLSALDYVELVIAQDSGSTLAAFPLSFTMSWVAPG